MIRDAAYRELSTVRHSTKAYVKKKILGILSIDTKNVIVRNLSCLGLNVWSFISKLILAPLSLMTIELIIHHSARLKNFNKIIYLAVHLSIDLFIRKDPLDAVE